MTDFTIMQWNTLANSLCDNKGFPKIEEKYLETEYRRNLQKNILLDKKCDIYTFQEVDQPDFYKQVLQNLGSYQVIWHKKPDEKDLYGIFFAFNLDKFTLVQEELIIYDTEPKKYTLLKIILKTNFNKQIKIITTHLKAKAGFESMRKNQVQQLLTHVSDDESFIIAGDFNDEPQSEAIQLIKYQSVFKDEQFTTYKHREKVYKRTIDYMFYKNVELKEKQPVVRDDEIGEFGLPNQKFPSDHLYLMSSFSI